MTATARRCSLFLLALPLALLAGCGSDPASPDTGQGAMSATVNGASWTAEPLLASAQHVASATTGGHVLITGINTGSYGISLHLNEANGPGTFTLSQQPFRVAVVVTSGGEGWGSIYGGSGTVTITTFTQNRIAGTFSFNAGPSPDSGAAGTLTVTNGAFDLALMRQ